VGYYIEQTLQAFRKICISANGSKGDFFSFCFPWLPKNVLRAAQAVVSYLTNPGVSPNYPLSFFHRYVEYVCISYLILRFAISKYFGSISIPMNFLFRFLQASPVEPEPINGSSIIPLGGVTIVIR